MTRSEARRELDPKCRPRDTLIARNSHLELPGVIARGGQKPVVAVADPLGEATTTATHTAREQHQLTSRANREVS